MRSKDRTGLGQKRITLIGGGGIAERCFAPRGLSTCGFKRQIEVFGSTQDFGKKSIGAGPFTLGRQQLCSQAFGLYQQQCAPVVTRDGQS